MNNLASIEKIDKINPHPNADLLDIAEVRNCNVIIPKNKYSVGEKVVFIWPDSILPDKPWAEFYKAKSSRVRAIKLRNEWSMGIVEKIETIVRSGDTHSEYADLRHLHDVEIGEEISSTIGVTKYEPPPPKDLQAKRNIPFGIPKTDEDNHYKFNALPFGEKVTISRKRDGSSFSCFYKLDEDYFGVMSRSLELKTECLNAFTEHIPRYDIENKLRSYCQKHQVSLCVRGESFGNGRNGHKANVDAKEQSQWEVFSVWDIDQHHYLTLANEHNFINVARACGFKHVPILEYDVELTPELIKKYAETKIGFEGVVVLHGNYVVDMPVKIIDCSDGVQREVGGTTEHQAGSFKIINKDYDSKK